MITIRNLASRRLRHNRSRSVLTAVALILTTTLLMAVGSAAIGLVDFQQKTIAYSTGNAHATFKGVTYEQGELLAAAPAVESLVLKESFADIVQDKLNGSLNYNNIRKEGITQVALTEGRMPEAENEIAGPPSLFERLNAEPVVGGKVIIAFRIQGQGEIITREFVITGLQEQADLSALNVSDARIAFGATISEALVRSYLNDEERYFSAQIRVDENASFEEIEQSVYALAVEAGVNEPDVSLNSAYLMWMTDPGSETTMAMAGIGLLVVLLGGLVIYNIYYVSVISNIQELGKLKALGATRKQMKQLLLTEGLTLAGISLPVGLVLGYLCDYGLFAFMRSNFGQDIGGIRIFSFPVVLIVISAVLATTCISLLTPMKMAAKISPVEAMRYQEQSAEGKSNRKGYQTVNLIRLSLANLLRNKKRTLATMATMGLTCVLFLAIATVLSNINTEDYARQMLTKGEFILNLNYSLGDTAYPENNLDFIQKDNPINQDLIERIEAIPGVTGIETRSAVSARVGHPGYPAGERVAIGSFSEADLDDLDLALRKGDIDYELMLAENGVIFTWDAFFEEYGLHIGDSIGLTLYSGETEVYLDAVLAASTTTSRDDFWIPEEILNRLLPDSNLYSMLYVYVEDSYYDSAKEALQQIESESLYFSMYSLDEEIRIAEAAINAMKMPIYGLLLIVGVISFMSLINTMITSILTRKRELGILQAIGLSNGQLRRMLQGEGMILIFGALLCGLVLGNTIGFIIVKIAAATEFITVKSYHYPAFETLVLIAFALLGQVLVTAFISRYIHKETLVSRISSQN